MVGVLGVVEQQEKQQWWEYRRGRGRKEAAD